MPYIGNPPAERFTSFAYQDLTGGSGTSFTLDNAVGNPQEIEVFVNNVRQEPGVAYTVSGTALTMTGSIASTDDFYVVFQGKAIQTATHPSDRALTATDGTFTGDLTVDTNTLHVDAANNRVGIGTTSPDRSLHITSSEPSVVLENSGQGTDLKTWRIYSNSSSLQIGTVDDAFAAGQNALEITRDNTDNITGIQFKTGASSEIGRFTTDGLTFNGDTAEANALDDYEEGTWTVTNKSVASLTITNTQTAYYVKIGRLVFFNFYITYPSTSDSNNAKISLPFASGVSTSQGHSYVTGRFQGTASNGIVGQIGNGTDEILFYPNASSTTAFTNANFSGKYLLMSGCYRASA